jgi:hypothetical protein
MYFLSLSIIKRNNMTKMTIAQQLKIKEFPFFIKNHNGYEIYYESESGFWIRREKDSNDNQTYAENSDGFWCKSEFDSNGKRTYYEDSDGMIEDNRPKPVELTMDEIAKKLGIDVTLLKIKK